MINEHPIFMVLHDDSLVEPLTLRLTAEYIDGEGTMFFATISRGNYDFSEEFNIYNIIEEALDDAVKQYRESVEESRK